VDTKHGQRQLVTTATNNVNTVQFLKYMQHREKEVASTRTKCPRIYTWRYTWMLYINTQILNTAVTSLRNYALS